MTLAVRVIPNAARTCIAGKRNGEWILRVGAPAVDGKANEAARRFLARKLGLPVSAVRLVKGDRNRHKKFEILGIDKGAAFESSLLSDNG